MVAQDAVTAWDLKPKIEDVNKTFNVLCNVQPVEHPWSGDWYARWIDVTTWSKEQFWLEKCKWLKRCDLYEYNCSRDTLLVLPQNDWEYDEHWEYKPSSKQIRNEALWSNANFTDAIVFQWYRIYMRKNNPVLNPYWRNKKTYNWKQYLDDWWDWDKNTCDEWDRPSNVIEDYSADSNITTSDWSSDRVNTFNTADRIRIYIQQVDTKACTWDTFDEPDEAPIVLVKEYEAASCNPDHFVMWYWGIWTPAIMEDAVMYMIEYWWNLFSYIIPNWDISIKPTDYVYIKDRWLYITWLQEPDSTFVDILWALDIPMWWYTVPDSAELTQMYARPEVYDWQDWAYASDNTWRIYIFSEFWEVPYFVAWNTLHSINWFYYRQWSSCSIPDDEDIYDVMHKWWVEDATPCNAKNAHYMERRIFIYDVPIETSTIWWWAITWLARWWARLAFVADNYIYVSWNWRFAWVFTSEWTDRARWPHSIPVWITDIRAMGWSLLMFWPKSIYAVASENSLVNWAFVSGTDNEDWFYSPWSFYNDDWQFLLARRWKVLWTLNLSIWYSESVSLSFDPSTGFYVNSHFKSLDNDYDMINIDADINKRYVSIYDDNDAWVHYSKLLIYDKHYKFRYRWIITWARIVHVKDNIFLWDWIYVNKWRTRWWRTDDTKWWEIIEIISAYVWEEWLQTPKHIQYVKTAIWDHSQITDDSYWDIDLSYGWRMFDRRVNVTTTRYPRLLFSKERTNVIESYEIGEEIYWHWKLLSHNLLNEISEYRNYDKFSKTIIREMWEDIDMWSKLALFASIKEPVNAPANVLELCISARKLDNVQFGSFYVWYYVLDADYEDIENTNIDQSLLSDRTKEQETVINKWEYCDEILKGSACDVQTFNS